MLNQDVGKELTPFLMKFFLCVCFDEKVIWRNTRKKKKWKHGHRRILQI